MSTYEYHHGARVIDVDDGYRNIRQVESSMISAVVTAPTRDTSAIPLNTPFLINGDTDILKKLGREGTGQDVADDILDQGAASIMMTVVNEGDTEAEMWSNVVGNRINKIGMHALLKAPTRLKVVPKILIAPGFTSGRPTDGLENVVVNDGGQDFTTAQIVVGGDGTGAVVTPVIQNGSIVDAVIVTAGHSYTEITLTVTGDGTGATLTGEIDTSANPVTAEMIGLANKFRACIFADGPNTTNEDAITYRGDFGARRLMIIDPYVKIFDTDANLNVARPSAARAAGLQSFMDNQRGFWWSMSNQPIVGVTDVARDIYYDIGDPDTEANYLNKNGVTTVIHDDGYRFSGLRTCSSDPKWQFLSSVRVTDNINDSMIQSFKWAKDRPMGGEVIESAIDSINDHLASLEALGAILDGTAWIDPNLNSRDQLMDGILRLEYDHEPPPPIEQMIIGSHRNSYYLKNMVTEVLRNAGTALPLAA